MMMLLNTVLLATAGLLTLAHGHEHGGQGDAHHHKFANDASSVREGIGLSDNSSSGQCIEINARQAGEQPEGLCIEINGARIGGIGGGDGKAQTTVTEIVTLGGAGMGNIHFSIMTEAGDGVETVTHLTTVTTTLAADTQAAVSPSPETITQASPTTTSVIADSTTIITTTQVNIPAASPTVSPPPPASPPAAPPVVPSAPSVPPPVIGSAGGVARGSGTPLSNGECDCMCLCDAGSFLSSNIAAVPVAPQPSPTTLQTIVSAAQGAFSELPAAITIPASTVSVPASLVAATGAPSIPGSIAESTIDSAPTTLTTDPGAQSIAQAGSPIPAATDSATSSTTSSTTESTTSPTTSDSATDSTISTTSTTLTTDSTISSVSSIITSETSPNVGDPLSAADTATADSVDINTLSLTSNLVLGSLAQPTIQI